MTKNVEELIGQINCGKRGVLQRTCSKNKLVVRRNDSEHFRELKRSRKHLFTVKNMYTKHLVLVRSIIRRCSSKSPKSNKGKRYVVGVNIRINQHMETLHIQLDLVTEQRDDINRKISDFEDKVINQFTHNEVERTWRETKLQQERRKQLNKEISTFKSSLDKSKQGLLAASFSQTQATRLKDELL